MAFTSSHATSLSKTLPVLTRRGMMGYQDTLMAHAQRQFYGQCYTFIFGNATVVFQNCFSFSRKPFEGQANMITAQARELSKILKFRSTTLKSGPHQTSGPLLTNTTLSWVGLGNNTLEWWS